MLFIQYSIMIFAVSVLGWRYKTAGVLLSILGFIYITQLSYKTTTYIIISFLYITLIPSQHWGEGFNIFPFYFNGKIFMFITFILYIIYFLEYKPFSSTHYFFDKTSFFLLLFIAWSLFQLLRGISLNNSTSIFSEFSYLSLYLSYYFWRSFFRRNNCTIYKYSLFVAIIGTILAFEYVFLIIYSFSDIINFILGRTITRQTQYAIIGMPISAALFFMANKNISKLLFIFMFLLFTIQILLSQQRTLWVVLCVMAFLFFTLYVFRNGVNRKSWLIWFSINISFVSIILLFFIFSSSYFDVDISFILRRWDTVFSLNDPSLKLRFFDLRHAISEVGNNWIWGLGFGRQMRSVPLGSLFHFFDSSYGVAYFKGGMIMTILLLSIYVSSLKKAIIIYKSSSDKNTTVICIALICIFVGIMLGGIVEVSMMYFRHIFIWMMCAAFCTHLYDAHIKRNIT